MSKKNLNQQKPSKPVQSHMVEALRRERVFDVSGGKVVIDGEHHLLIPAKYANSFIEFVEIENEPDADYVDPDVRHADEELRRLGAASLLH